MLRLIASAVLLMAVGAAPLRADEPVAITAADDAVEIRTGRHEFALASGAGLPQGSIDLSAIHPGEKHKLGRPGFLISAQYYYLLHPRLSLGAELSGSWNTPTHNNAFIANGDATIRSETQLALALVRFTPYPEAKLKPYLVAGAGMFKTRIDMRVQPDNNWYWSDSGTSEERNVIQGMASGFASSLRAGLDYRLREGVWVGLEGGLDHCDKRSYQAGMLGRSMGLDQVITAVNRVRVSARMGYLFGGKGS